MKTGYFLCADIMGFSCIVKNLEKDALDEKINDWIELVESAAKNNEIKEFQIISDTVFVGVGKEKSDLKKLIDFSRNLLEQGIKKSLLIRGAISYGEFTWGQLVYGSVVINAHKLETEHNWIGIAIDNVINLNNQVYSELNIACYPVPIYNNLVVNYSAIVWDVPQFKDLIRYSTSGGLTVKNEKLNWKWAEKIQNTVIFGLYLEIIKHKKTNLFQYHGLHPIEFIDDNFREILAHHKSI